MTCDRCAEQDQVRLGTDEHGLTCAYRALCESCRESIQDAQAHEQELAQPADPHRDAGWAPARETRDRVGRMQPGDPRYRECYGLPPLPRPGRSWRDVA